MLELVLKVVNAYELLDELEKEYGKLQQNALSSSIYLVFFLSRWIYEGPSRKREH